MRERSDHKRGVYSGSSRAEFTVEDSLRKNWELDYGKGSKG